VRPLQCQRVHNSRPCAATQLRLLICKHVSAVDVTVSCSITSIHLYYVIWSGSGYPRNMKHGDRGVSPSTVYLTFQPQVSNRLEAPRNILRTYLKSYQLRGRLAIRRTADPRHPRFCCSRSMRGISQCKTDTQYRARTVVSS